LPALPLAAVSGQSRPGQIAVPLPGEPPLGGFASQKLAVMPVQFLRGDSLSLVKSADWAALRIALDDSIGGAIAARGIGKKWAYAADIARLAKRNSDYASDPYSLGAAGFRNPQKKPGDPAPSGVVNNLRSVIALGDARYALIPVDLWFGRKAGATHPILSVVLVDGRAGSIVWFSDVIGDAGTTFSAAEIGALAARVADLISPR